jgi:putative spermidine/putrescine transport system ATP-binding protein
MTTDMDEAAGAATAPAPRKGFNELRLSGVSRSYGGVAALHPLDLTIHGGEFVALLGPSGCGKSTALNCVAGLLPLTGGSIELDGTRIDTLPPEKRGFGMVFQNYALFPHLTARANIGFGLKMHKVPKAEAARRVEEVVALTRLSDHAHKHPGQLSGGQQQRVAIARAIVMEPPLVLMDEPLSNLDAALRLDMRAEIRRIHQRLGLTTLYVTHDQEEALSMADRLVVLREGHVAQIGTPAELYENPDSVYVAGFMGYRNLLALGTDGTGLELRGTLPDGTVLAPDHPMTAAIRPEDLEIGEGANTIIATVEVVEYHGRERYVQAQTATGARLHAKTTKPVAVGDSLPFTADPARVRLFEEET